jgi:hypothetical protein
VVRKIIHIAAKLDAESLAERESLRKSHVELGKSGTAQSVPGQFQLPFFIREFMVLSEIAATSTFFASSARADAMWLFEKHDFPEIPLGIDAPRIQIGALHQAPGCRGWIDKRDD